MLTKKQIEQLLSNPATADWSKLSKNDIGFAMGPALTEEQMKAYCAANGIAPRVVKAPTNSTNSTTKKPTNSTNSTNLTDSTTQMDSNAP
jgi:hypothetical protein